MRPRRVPIIPSGHVRVKKVSGLNVHVLAAPYWFPPAPVSVSPARNQVQANVKRLGCSIMYPILVKNLGDSLREVPPFRPIKGAQMRSKVRRAIGTPFHAGSAASCHVHRRRSPNTRSGWRHHAETKLQWTKATTTLYPDFPPPRPFPSLTPCPPTEALTTYLRAPAAPSLLPAC